MYKAREPKFLWILLFVMSLFYAIYQENPFTILFIVLAIVFLIIMFSHYTLIIDENTLIFKYHLGGITLIQRKVTADSIIKITFITSSRQTIALVQLQKGFRLKLHRFQPVDFIQDLKEFAEEHEVQTEETSFLKQSK